MNLTGKCKIDFEKWFNKTYSRELVYSTMNETLIKTLPIPFVYGVLVDYFDSVGIYVGVLFRDVYWISINDSDIFKYFKTLEEARTKAIEKADKIKNEQLNN